MIRRSAGAAVAATVAVVAIGGAPAPAALAAPGTAAAANTTERVLVVLQDALSATPATRAHVGARKVRAVEQQDAVLTDLSGPAPSQVHHFVVGNTVAAKVTVTQAAQLRADPRVKDVVVDAPTQAPVVTPAAASASAAAGAAAPRAVPASACTGTAAKGQLEPQGLSVIHARSDNPADKTAAQLGLDGAGVKVAFIADGLDPANVDFRRADGTSAIVDSQTFVDDADENGGAEAFGDAGTIAAQGIITRDLATVVNPVAVTLPGGGHCYIRVEGVAPGVGVVALRGLSGQSFISALQAVDYAVTTARVDVINESFGFTSFSEGNARNLIVAANSAAVAAGVTVVVSSGDAGYNGTIGTPGAGPDVITVGASTHLRSSVQIGSKAAGTAGTGWADDEISAISSSGVMSNGRTVDLVAPGDSGWAPCSTNLSAFEECTSLSSPNVGTDLQVFDGTSQAAPFTSGTAALVIQAYRRTHNGASPSPALVKRILLGTATDLGAPADQQGAGRLDARAAAEAALDWTGATTTTAGTTPHLIGSDGAVVAVGAPGAQPGSSTRTFTNTGTVAVPITPRVRSLEPGTTSSVTVAVPRGNAGQQFVDGDQGALLYDYATTPLSVAAGDDVVRVSASGVSSVPGVDPSDVIGPQMSLFDPSGRLAASTFLQGTYESRTEVVLSDPTPGQWTAVVFVPDVQPITRVTVAAETFGWHNHAWATPSAGTVPAGGSVAVTVTPTIPAAGGDAAYALDLGTPVAASTPVILRTLLQPSVATPAPFAATLRAVTVAETRRRKRPAM